MACLRKLCYATRQVSHAIQILWKETCSPEITYTNYQLIQVLKIAPTHLGNIFWNTITNYQQILALRPGKIHVRSYMHITKYKGLHPYMYVCTYIHTSVSNVESQTINQFREGALLRPTCCHAHLQEARGGLAHWPGNACLHPPSLHISFQESQKARVHLELQQRWWRSTPQEKNNLNWGKHSSCCENRMFQLWRPSSAVRLKFSCESNRWRRPRWPKCPVFTMITT